MRSLDLSPLQLEIVMHIANGMTFDEIAKKIDRSTVNTKKHAGIARRKMGVRTLPQLVSAVIANGQLEWQDNHRVLNGTSPDVVAH